jgi:hypothetical protein
MAGKHGRTSTGGRPPELFVRTTMPAEHSKIFGIGLSRTGTLSLSAALQTLGIETRHYPNDVRTQDELRRGYYELSILQTVQAITDIVVSPFYAQFDTVYRDSRFILTTRPTDAWLTSVEKHFRNYVEFRRDPFDDFVLACVYGTLHFSSDRLRYVKELHEENVGRYFASEPHKLLVLDVSTAAGWEPLCAFLDRPVPQEPYPHLNKERAEPAVPRRRSWRRLFGRRR